MKRVNSMHMNWIIEKKRGKRIQWIPEHIRTQKLTREFENKRG